MRIRYAHVLLITEVILVITLASRGIASSKDQNQPLSNAEKMLRDMNLTRVMSDPKEVNNMTNMLSDMAANMRKMFAENKKMQQQMQEILTRVSNTTGINATGMASTVQQRTESVPLNLTSITGSLSNMLPKTNSKN